MVPQQLRLRRSERRLDIDWPDGTQSSFSHSVLRAACLCATCRQAKRTGKSPGSLDAVALVGIEPFGPSAVHLAFSDGHAGGLFPFAYLRALCGQGNAIEEAAADDRA
jgi:DUF971 family protein